MGGCFSHDSRRKHQRLDEYDDDCFFGVENRSIVTETSPGWLGETLNQKAEIQQKNGNDQEKRNHSFPECNWAIPASESEPLPATRSFEDLTFSLSSPPAVQAMPAEPILQSNDFATGMIAVQKQETFWAGHNSGWYDREKGRALQLRLAKHRVLQMAVTDQASVLDRSPANTTPTTVGSDFFSETDAISPTVEDDQDWSVSQSRPDPILLFSKPEDEDKDLNQTSGLIWKEISCESNVTAVAMNRIQDHSSAPENLDPLFLAMGDEKGNIVITEILDESFQDASDEIDGGNSLSQSKKKLGSEMVEFSIDGKVRSLDFGSYEQLVVGGDGCYAWILQVIVDQDEKTPQDVVVVYKLERIDRIYTVRFSHDQKFVAVGGFDGKVAFVSMTNIWNEDEQDKENPIIELDRPGLIYCLDWNPKGNYLAIAGSDKICSIYNASSFELIHETTSRSTTIQDIRWSNNGKFLAIGDREVEIIRGKPPFKSQRELTTNATTSPMDQFRYRVTSLYWSPSDAYLAIGGNDGRCLLMETAGWALVYEHNAMNSINALVWGQRIYSSDGDVRRYLVLSDDERNISLLKAGVEPETHESTDDVSSIASSSYQSQSTMSSDWVLRDDEFQDADDVKEMLTQGLKSKATITAIAFSKIGAVSKTSSYLAYAADDCSLTIMRSRDWKTVFQVEFAKPIRSLAFSNSNNYLALGGDEGILNVLSVRSRTMILNSILSSAITSIAFSKNDERLGVGLEDGIMTLMSPDSNWESVGEIDQSEACISSQDWSSNMLACARMNGAVTLFDLDKVLDNFFVPVKEFTSNHPVRSLTFGTNGKLLAIAGDNGIVSILSAQNGWDFFHRINIGYSILSIQWSPSGRYLSLASVGSPCSVYDTTTWTIVKQVEEAVSSTYTDDDTWVSCLAWSIDAKWMAMGGMGSGINILDASTWTFIESSASDDSTATAKSKNLDS